MTIIVADRRNRLMAADTLVTEDDLKVYHTAKIFRCADGALVGAAGENDACFAFLDWAVNGRKGKPTRQSFKGMTGMVLEPSGRLLRFEGHPRPDELLDAATACGSGREVAMGALHVGASAEAAVRAAIALSAHCGGDVTVLALDTV